MSISNSNLGQNADALLCTMSHKDDILWAGQERIPEGKFGLTY